MTSSPRYRIGDVAARVAVSVDTLRYYEKIGLLPRVARTHSGNRAFDDRDIARIRFIRRARAMHFSLAEISALLALRDGRARSKSRIRGIARTKLREIDERVAVLRALRDDLQSLVDACPGAAAECPILAGIEGSGADR